jgi:hypothetical protein
MYLKEGIDEATGDYIDIDPENPEIAELFSKSGLFIKSRGDEYVKVKIPTNSLAFQIGMMTAYKDFFFSNKKGI